MANTFASKLKELRERNALSLQELADLVGVAKQSIHKFENGVVTPSSESILRLSNALSVPYSYFFEDADAYNYSVDNIKFREGQKILNRDDVALEIQKQVIRHISRFLELEAIMNIERSFENPLIGLDIEDERDVEKAAKTLRKKWKLGMGPIADVVELLESKGIFVVEVSRSEDFQGLSGMLKEFPIIVLNENSLTIERKRFTALHELAHLILTFADQFTDKKIEFLCNYFAGAVLVVDEMLFNELGKNRTLISLAELRRIKELYGISVQAIIVRAKNTGFINDKTFKDWNTTYNEWRQDESRKGDFGRFQCSESTNRFKSLLAQGVSEKRLSWSKAAELADVKIEQIKREIGGLTFIVNR